VLLLEDVLMDHRNHNLDTQSSSKFRQRVSYKSTSENWSPENQMVSFFVIHWQMISSFYPKHSDHAGTRHMVGKNNCLLEVTVSVTSDQVRPKNHFVCRSAPSWKHPDMPATASLLMGVSSLSGRHVTIPNGIPQGVMVALWLGWHQWC
jgi:hypothetical protein